MHETKGDDETTYVARVMRIARMMDIRNAFVTNAQISVAQRVLEQQRKGEIVDDVMEVERAAAIVENNVHPDTQKPVSPFFLRLSFLVPANCFLDACMILARGPIQVAGAQILNQTYNAAHYRALRNASNSTDGWKLNLSYIAATGSAVGAALGINRFASHLRSKPSSTMLGVVLRRASPFLAVATADVLNLGIMRQDEWRQGIVVRNPDTGESLGHSKVAGMFAVGACIGSRVFAAAPVLLTSSLAHYSLEHHPLTKHRPVLRVSITLLMLATAIQVAVPLVFGLFRQDARMNIAWLEPHLLEKAKQQNLHQVQYHKGL